MKHAICPSCGGPCIKYGKNKSGTQRWRCNACSMIITPKFDNAAKQLQVFLKWLFGKQTQREMPAEGRTFRRKAKQFWDIWRYYHESQSLGWLYQTAVPALRKL